MPTEPISSKPDKTPFPAYITNYALTSGIILTMVKPTVTPGTVSFKLDWYDTYVSGEGKNWHRTWESALKRAKEMRDKKIKSMGESLRKLKKMSFEEPAMETTPEV